MVERILVYVVLVDTAITVVVLPDLGGGVAICLQHGGERRRALRKSAVEAALRIPAGLMLTCVPAGAGRAADASRRISVGEKNPAFSQTIHIRRVDVRGRVFVGAQICVALIIDNDD